MEIKYRDIILRDMVERDIEDYIRWYNVDTEWGDWDAPDKPIESVDPDIYRARMLEWLKKPSPNFRTHFEIATADGSHIGSVNCYAIDEHFKLVPMPDAVASGVVRWTLGLGICESRLWGMRLGTKALTAFICYFLENGKWPIHLQTWSGNIRMIRCAQRLGFVECNRFVGNRQIRGGTYDSLTFCLDETIFNEYMKNNP